MSAIPAQMMANVRAKSPPSTRRRIVRTNPKKQTNDDEFMAAAIGDVEWLRQSLRENRGEIHYDKNGLAPIHLAAIHGRLDCLKLLVEKSKVDVNLPSTTGWRPIHLCISNQTGKRSFQCLVYLLEHDADPNLTNDDNITAVHQAASEGHVQCLKLLIEIGAKIDIRDCRGHLPLDLAKLWGHRKCARILAAEAWNRDKEFIAKEMSQLKKIRMQQIIRQMEDEAQHKAEQDFYGEKAYKNWLTSKGLKTEPTKAELSEKEKQAQARKAAAKAMAKKEKGETKKKKEFLEWREDTKDSLFKPNSLLSKSSLSRTSAPKTSESKQGEKRPVTPKRVQVVSKEDAGSKRPFLQTASTMGGYSEDWGFGIDETADDYKREVTFEDDKKEKGPTFYNTTPWNKSPKIPPPEYVSNLKDAYPRDFYTMMPHHQATPAELNIRKGAITPPAPRASSARASSAKNKSAKTKTVQIDTKKKLRMPNLPHETIMKALATDPLKYERPVVYKCRNIIDAQTKHKYDLDEVPNRSEVTIHLSDAMDSVLFNNSLQPALQYDGASSRTSSTSMSRLNWRDDSYPVDRVVQTMKNMTQPDYFPNVKGDTYDLNFGDLSLY